MTHYTLSMILFQCSEDSQMIKNTYIYECIIRSRGPARLSLTKDGLFLHTSMHNTSSESRQ